MVFGGYTAASSRGKGYSGCHGERVFLKSQPTPRCDPISEPLSAAASCPGTVHVFPVPRPSGFLAGARACPGAPMFGTSSAVQADRGDEAEMGGSARSLPPPRGPLTLWVQLSLQRANRS